jgi:hypothetical protein
MPLDVVGCSCGGFPLRFVVAATGRSRRRSSVDYVRRKSYILARGVEITRSL